MHNQFENTLQLKENTVHIWCIKFEVEQNQLNHFVSILSYEERERANKFRFYKDKCCYVVTRGILRLLSSRYLKIKPKEVAFAYEAYGKPKFKHKTNLNFNVSHSGNRAIIGFVYNHTIGVDIEKIKNDFDTLEIAENFFSKNEIKALHKISKEEQHIAFYRCWTRKEAFIKAKGSGLSFPLNTFSVTLDSDLQANLVETKWDKKEKNNWNLHTFKPSQDYIGAVIVGNKVLQFKYNDIAASDFY